MDRDYTSLKLNGVCWQINDTGIDVGAAYASGISGTQFSWQSYNLATGEWKQISDWSGSNWTTWRPTAGNYWLHVEAKSVDGNTASDTICFSVDRDYNTTLRINGVCWQINDTGIDVGAAYTSGLSGTQFSWQSYNLDTREWKQIADWNGSNWATWIPTAGNYWLHVEAKSADGSTAEETICFKVDRNYN